MRDFCLIKNFVKHVPVLEFRLALELKNYFKILNFNLKHKIIRVNYLNFDLINYKLTKYCTESSLQAFKTNSHLKAGFKKFTQTQKIEFVLKKSNLKYFEVTFDKNSKLG